jgi:hypothetical protein
MATYCVPQLSNVPGFPASEFDWWRQAPNPASLRYYPDNPNWLGAFSLSEGSGQGNSNTPNGAGANRHVQFRALKGMAPKPVNGDWVQGDHLFLSWVIRVASLDTMIDRLNIVLGDGANYVALQVKLASTSSTVAGMENNGIYSYRMHSCSVSAAGAISLVNPALGGTFDLETTGRMWVDVTSPTRQLDTKWAFQVAIPLNQPWAPSLLTLPQAGAFKLWYEVWISLPGRTVPYQIPATPTSVITTAPLQIVPAGLQITHMLDMSTGAANCTDGVKIDWGSVGARNVAAGDPPRTGTTDIRLDLGQDYPPNKAMPANGGTLYNEGYTPNVAQTRFQNQLFAQPTFPAGLSQAQREAVRARFSLANWGSQISQLTGSSWRPIPGGEDVHYTDAQGDMRFVWPLPGPGGADSFTTTLVRNINKYLNHVWNNTLAQVPDAQHPHQCMLVEISSTDSSVIITRSSIYQNMNVSRASVSRDVAQISVVGLQPISAQPRDVYLYLQTFNMPKVATDPDLKRLRREFDAVSVIGGTKPPVYENEVEDIAAFYPTYIVHAFHDTGKTMKLEDGREVPILRPQTSFGYFALHTGNLYGWETRLYGAEKITENLYRVRVPNNGTVNVETAIQARESANEQPLPPDEIPGCCNGLAAWLDTKGPIGRALARVVRLVCKLLGQPTT